MPFESNGSLFSYIFFSFVSRRFRGALLCFFRAMARSLLAPQREWLVAPEIFPRLCREVAQRLPHAVSEKPTTGLRKPELLF